MSLLSALNNESLRREAFARAGADNPAVGSPERDWAENGWPAETALRRLEEGVKHGRSAPGWSSARGESGEALLSMELSGPSGFIHVLLDPAARVAAFKSAGMAYSGGSLEEVARSLAQSSHQAGARLRSMSPPSLRVGLWQGEAPEALKSMEPGMARNHPMPGEDPADAWEAAFERVDAACEKERDPLAAMERARAQYKGSSERQMGEWIADEIRSGPNAVAGGTPARVVAIGARGLQIRAAIPMRADGTVDEGSPIMAISGREGGKGFAGAGGVDGAMRFYSLEAFTRFASSAQGADLSAYPPPSLELDAAASLAARRQGRSVASKPAGPGV